MTDKQKKQEHATWEALHDVHDSIVNALKESSTNMMGVYSTKGLASFIRGDKNEVRISIYGLARDRKVFDKELREIKQSYADKKGIIGGDAVDEDDFSIEEHRLAIQVAENYDAIKTKMELILTPVTNMQLGFASDAANRMSAAMIQESIAKQKQQTV